MPKQEKKIKKKARELSRISSEEVELKKAKIVKKREGGKKKVSKKKRATQTYKWVKHMFAELDELKERLDLIERFLGGRESMRKVMKEDE